MTLPNYWFGATYGNPSAANPEQANHMTNPKPVHDPASLPVGWATYSPSNATFEYSDGGLCDGIVSKHIKITGGAGVASTCGIMPKTFVNGEISEGNWLTVGIMLGEVALTGCNLAIAIGWYTDGGAAVGSASVSSALGTPSSFAPKIFSAQCPATATKYKVYVRARSDFGDGDVQEYSIAEGICIHTNSAAPVYYDGDTPNCHWASAWDGSASHKYLARPEDGYWVIEDNTAHWHSAIYSPAISVAAGQYYGAIARITMDAVTGGTFSGDIVWCGEDDSYLAADSFTGYLTTAAAEATYGNRFQAPAGATQARLRLCWNTESSATGDCKAMVRDIAFGEGVGRAPMVLPCSDQLGDGPAPWALSVDALTQELAAFYAGRYPDETADHISLFAIEAVDLTWTGGVAAAESAGYPDGSGDTCHKVQSATEESAVVTVPDGVLEGDYLPVAKVKHDSGGTATIRRQGQDAVSISRTTLGLLPLGTMHLKPGDTFTVYLTGDDTHYGWLNALFFVPNDPRWGGAVGWRSATHAHTLEFADDLLLVNGSPALANLGGGYRQILGRGGMLVVVAETSTPAAYTPLALVVAAEPHWEQFPSAS